MELVPVQAPRSESDDRGARLRRLISRKRSEKERLLGEIAERKREVAELRAKQRRCLDPLDDEIHEHFAYVLQPRRFDSGVRAEIEDLYQALMVCETISTRAPVGGAAEVDVDVDGECPCPRCAAAREAERRAGPEDPPAPDGSRAGPDRSIRDLYHDLAARCHPDKAGDEETRAANEELMREINGAYRAGDLDALAALSEELGFEIAGDGVLEALAAQYEQVKAEVRSLRRDPLGELVVATRRSRRRGVPTPLEAISIELDERCEHLESLASVFRAFRSGDLSAEDFLVELLEPDDDSDDDILDDEELLDALLAVVSEAAARRRR